MFSVYIPKAGDPCEIRSNGVKWRASWVKVKLLFATDQLFVFEHNASGNHFCERLGEIEIRPQQPLKQEGE